jgi:hypothetical protein
VTLGDWWSRRSGGLSSSVHTVGIAIINTEQAELLLGCRDGRNLNLKVFFELLNPADTTQNNTLNMYYYCRHIGTLVTPLCYMPQPNIGNTLYADGLKSA